MSKHSQELINSLTNACEFLKGDTTKGRYSTITIVPVKAYDAATIKAIRKKTELSQGLFAAYLGVSQKTVEAWEAGTNIPNGPSSRLLSMLENDDKFIKKYPFVKK